MRIQPFCAWRPRSDLASKIAAVPYDVVDTAEAMALAAGNPCSFLHVSRSEIDLPAGTDPHSEAAYLKAKANLTDMQQQGILQKESLPSFYLYRLVMNGRAQCGIVAGCAVDDYIEQVIKTHEKTRQDKEDDRTHHIEVLNAHAEPIFITFRDTAGVSALIEQTLRREPLYDFTAVDGIRNTLWLIPDTQAVLKAFEQVPNAYIADGHHRAAAAVRVARAQRLRQPSAGPSAEFNWFMAVLFPASQVKILPYNRCVRDLNGLTPTQFVEQVRSKFALTGKAEPSPAGPGEVSMYVAGKWYSLRWTPDPKGGAAALDVSVLQDRLLAPILGINDPRTDQRIEFVGGIRGTDELVNRVNSGRAAVAFCMFPTLVDQMMAIADSGGIMPPKSTWFEPKLRSGLFVHMLD